jgi:hypothetical protein
MMSLPGETMNTTDQVQKPVKKPILYPVGYKAEVWDDYEPEPVKLCKVADPDCEACQ